MSCRLSLFGPPTLLDRDGRPVPVPAKTFALAAYILLSGGGPVSRASLRQFLWPNADPKTAAANMRKFLLRVRERQERFGFKLIRCERNHVELVRSARIDLAAFLKIAAAPESSDILPLCELYRGDLLEGLSWEEIESSEWLELQRTKLRDAFAGALTSRLELIDRDADRITLRMAARRLVEVDPYNETGHRALMRLFAEDGEPARIRDTYRNLEERLRADLGVEPDPVTTDLAQELLQMRLAPKKAPVEMPSAPKLPAEPVTEGVAPEGRSFVPPLASPSARSGVPRITILPPAGAGAHSHSHLMATSLIEDVTISLCRFKSLTVVAPHTAWELSHSAKKAELLASFNIDYVVETSLQNHSDSTKLAVRLLNFVTRDILWVEQLEFNAATMARQYRQISARIVLLLVDAIERSELAGYEIEQDTTAYHLYLAGQRCLHTLGLPSVRRARRLFKASVGKCADFVPAISGLARTYQREWLLMARGDEELLAEAQRLANMARDVDPDDARGFRELGVSSLYFGQFDESLRAFEQAELRNAQHADLLVDYADALEHACEPAKALEKVTSAIDLNPLCPDWYWWVAGGANFHLRRYRDAIAAMSHMRDQSPAYRLMAASWAMLGERDRAKSFVKKTKEIHPDFNVSGWMSIVPIRDREYAQHYEHGLREAGFNRT